MEYYRKIREGRLPWYLFYAGLTIELLIVIIDKSNYINPAEGKLFRLTFLLFALKILLTEYAAKEWGVILCLELIAVISYRVTGANDLIRLVTFVAACKDIPLRQMLKYAFQVTLAGCAVIIVLALTGIYGEVSLTGLRERQSGKYALCGSRPCGGDQIYPRNGASQRAFLYVPDADADGCLCLF